MSLRTVGGGASTAASDTVVSTRYVYGPSEVDARFIPNTSLVLNHEHTFDASKISYFPKLGHEHDFSRAEMEIVGELMCVKDGWADTNIGALSTAADTANHDSSHLRVATETGLGPPSTLAVKSLIGFNLSSFPAGATVTSATLILRPVAGGEPGNLQIRHITSASEGWAEATLVATNFPGVTGPSPAFTITTSTASDTALDVTTFTTMLSNRIGTAMTASFALVNATTGTTFYFVSKDFPAGSTQFGPRLKLKFTVPA